MNTVPANSAEAAKYIKKLAKEDEKTVFEYCQKRGIHSSIINQWEKRKKGYNAVVFLRLIKKV